MKLHRRIEAVLWLHAIRTRRLSWNLVDFTIAMYLWGLINALMIRAIFGPEGWKLAIVAIPWIYYTIGVSLTAGWINYYTATGMPEYDIYAGSNPLLTVAGRIITAAAAATPPALALAATLHIPADPVELTLVCVSALLIGHSYSLLITALGATQGIPGTLLDLIGYASSILGGLLIPLRYFPEWLRLLALTTPLAPLGEAARAAADPRLAWLSPHTAWLMIASWIIGLYTAAWIASRMYMRRVRREGVKITRY